LTSALEGGEGSG